MFRDSFSDRELTEALEAIDAGDRLVLVQLEAAGSNLALPHRVESTLFFSERTAADAAAARLGEWHFLTKVEPAADDPATWQVSAERLLVPHPANIIVLRERLEELAHEFGGEFDGWCAPVTREAPEGWTPSASPAPASAVPAKDPLGLRPETILRLARIVTKRPEATLISSTVKTVDRWRENVVGLRFLRYEGEVEDGGERIPWSAFTKALRDAGVVTDGMNEATRTMLAACSKPDGWSFWAREHEFLGRSYAPCFPMSGGLRTPRYYWALRMPTMRVMFLESLVEGSARRWKIERFARAARSLGAWQAAMAGSAEALAVPILVADKIRTFLINDERTLELPPEPEPLRMLLRRVWEARLELLARHDRCTPPVCHPALATSALFEDATDPDVTVVNDWEHAGRGPLGQDLSSLIFEAVQSERIRLDQLQVIETALFDAYLDGLREAGWSGDAAEIRFAYAASAALAWGIRYGQFIQLARTPSFRTLATLAAHALRLGDEALASLATAP